MKTIEEALSSAADEVRQKVAQVPARRPGSAPEHFRAVRVARVVALVAVVLALASVLFILDPGSSPRSFVAPPSEPAREADLAILFTWDVDPVQAEIAAAEVASWDGVEYASFWGPARTYQEFREMFADQAELVAIVEEDPSILPASVRVWLAPGADSDAVAERARQTFVDALSVWTRVEGDAEAAAAAPWTTTPGGESAVTTIAVPTQLETAGIALQDEILADGQVSRDEFVRAVSRMAACMTERGLTGVTWSVEDDGTWGAGYIASEGSASGNAVEVADEAVYDLCYFSYVDRLGLPPKTTELTDSQSWLTLGEPVSDEQFLALVGDGLGGYVPGSAIRLAWSPAYLGRFDVGVFAVQNDIVLSSGAILPQYCMIDYAAAVGDPQDWAGGARCAESVDQFETMISTFGFGASGSCAGWLGNVAYVWGVPAGVASVEFGLRDGTVLTANVDRNGYALVAWDVDIPLVAVTYEGISAENAAVLDLKPGNAKSCAEMSASKPG